MFDGLLYYFKWWNVQNVMTELEAAQQRVYELCKAPLPPDEAAEVAAFDAVWQQMTPRERLPFCRGVCALLEMAKLTR